MGKTVALIPARGGSKGLPGKNIRPLAGKPLIQYSIDAALACPLVDAVYISTDDPNIADIAITCGGQLAPLRPPELAMDTTPAIDVARHFLRWLESLEESIDTLVLLQPTSPLRTVAYLTEALLYYQALETEGMVASVAPAKPLAWQASVTEAGYLAFHQANTEANRQTQPPNYHLNGAIYIAPPARYQNGTLLAQPVYPYVMPPDASVDIDSLTDFMLAELLLGQPTNRPSATLVEQ